jgi:hypothetical protein
MNRVLMMILSDGLRLPSGFVAESPHRCLIYCKVPDTWVEGEVAEATDLWLKGPSLMPDKLELLLEALYGTTWRRGNSDGSQYVVQGMGARLLNPSREAEKPWQHDDPNNKQLRFFHYVVGTDGQFKLVSPAEL